MAGEDSVSVSGTATSSHSNTLPTLQHEVAYTGYTDSSRFPLAADAQQRCRSEEVQAQSREKDGMIGQESRAYVGKCRG